MPRKIKAYHACCYCLDLLDEGLIAEEAVPCNVNTAEDDADKTKSLYCLRELRGIENILYVEDEHQQTHGGENDPHRIEPFVTEHTADICMEHSVDRTLGNGSVIHKHDILHKEYHPYEICQRYGYPHGKISLRHTVLGLLHKFSSYKLKSVNNRLTYSYPKSNRYCIKKRRGLAAALNAE
ncbi:unknown [Clostridium sp. CAG:413]|nr:unknown [Clostridium sp. CAG:413]